MAIAFNVGDKVEVLSESDGWGMYQQEGYGV